ncbi:hypothetical protein FHS85_005208 [Rhodoligotrophos appendicifer]
MGKDTGYENRTRTSIGAYKKSTILCERDAGITTRINALKEEYSGALGKILNRITKEPL